MSRTRYLFSLMAAGVGIAIILMLAFVIVSAVFKASVFAGAIVGGAMFGFLVWLYDEFV